METRILSFSSSSSNASEEDIVSRLNPTSTGDLSAATTTMTGELSSSGVRSSKFAIQAPDHVHELLDHLHELSTAQEAGIIQPTNLDVSSPEYHTAFEYMMRDKFIALDQDKAQFVYNLLRATGANTVVEAGTSYGVSTIYLSLAVGQNVKEGRGTQKKATVIATEHEAEKAKVAKQHWDECGPEVSSHIELREGDIKETLKEDMPEVDLLLLDIWTPLALPVLKLIMPRMKRGAIVITDNTVKSVEGYAALLAVLRAPGGPFRSLTLPYSNGLEMSTYLP